MPIHCALTSFPLTVSAAGPELGIDGGLLDILVMNPFFRFQLTWMAEEN